MKKTWLIMILLAGNSAFASGIQWHSFNKGLKLIKEQNKPGLVDFYADWCKWCKVMEKTTFPVPEVQKTLNQNYICIRIDPDKEKEKLRYNGLEYDAMTFAGMLGVQGFPSLVFLDKNGDIITMLPGYMTADRLLPILGYINEECYKQKVTLKQYMDKKGKCK